MFPIPAITVWFMIRLPIEDLLFDILLKAKSGLASERKTSGPIRAVSFVSSSIFNTSQIDGPFMSMTWVLLIKRTVQSPSVLWEAIYVCESFQTSRGVYGVNHQFQTCKRDAYRRPQRRCITSPIDVEILPQTDLAVTGLLVYRQQAPYDDLSQRGEWYGLLAFWTPHH